MLAILGFLRPHKLLRKDLRNVFCILHGKGTNMGHKRILYRQALNNCFFEKGNYIFYQADGHPRTWALLQCITIHLHQRTLSA